jgi:hypothetical protein
VFYQHRFSGLLKVNTQEKCPASEKYLFQLQYCMQSSQHSLMETYFWLVYRHSISMTRNYISFSRSAQILGTVFLID